MNFAEIVKRNWPTLVVAILPFILLALFWNRLPGQVPLHWNVNGEIDNYGPKATLVIFPFITFSVVVLLWAVPFIDPKKKGEYFQPTLNTLGLVLAAFMLFIFILILVSSLGYKKDISSFVIIGVLLLLMIIGNYFGKLRPNYFVGIRTPWTLEKEEVWIKTHRFAGVLWVFGSLCMIVLTLFMPREAFAYVFIPFIILISTAPLIYSYIIYKK
ncbi:MAG: SdpI family protein [Bacteroidia bacterium]